MPPRLARRCFLLSLYYLGVLAPPLSSQSPTVFDPTFPPAWVGGSHGTQSNIRLEHDGALDSLIIPKPFATGIPGKAAHYVITFFPEHNTLPGNSRLHPVKFWRVEQDSSSRGYHVLDATAAVLGQTYVGPGPFPPQTFFHDMTAPHPPGGDYGHSNLWQDSYKLAFLSTKDPSGPRLFLVSARQPWADVLFHLDVDTDTSTGRQTLLVTKAQWLGDGPGTPQPTQQTSDWDTDRPSQQARPSRWSTGVEVGDFDNDGASDDVLLSYRCSHLRVYTLDWTPAPVHDPIFTEHKIRTHSHDESNVKRVDSLGASPPYSNTLGFLLYDNDPPLPWPSHTGMVPANGWNGLSFKYHFHGAGWRGLAIADIDGDGLLDAAVARKEDGTSSPRSRPFLNPLVSRVGVFRGVPHPPYLVWWYDLDPPLASGLPVSDAPNVKKELSLEVDPLHPHNQVADGIYDAPHGSGTGIGSPSLGVAFADLNQDGLQDLVVPVAGGPYITGLSPYNTSTRIYLNNRVSPGQLGAPDPGTYNHRPSYELEQALPGNRKVGGAFPGLADLDLDPNHAGMVDIVMMHTGHANPTTDMWPVQVFVNRTMTPGGNMSLVFHQSLDGSGLGALSSAQFPARDDGRYARLFDFDGDGKPELITSFFDEGPNPSVSPGVPPAIYKNLW